MIQQVLNKALLVDVLEDMQGQAETSAEEERRDRTGTPFDDLGTAESKELLEGIRGAKEFLAEERKKMEPERRGGDEEIPQRDRVTYIPRSPELANLQAAIEEYFLEQRTDVVETSDSEDRRGPETPAGSQLTIWHDYLSDRRLFGAFEQTDIGWINALFAKGIRKFRRKHKFVERPARKGPISFPDERVRMLVVGDWGSGIPRAQSVARHMREKLDDPMIKDWQKHVIHLGDVYYAGWESEYKNRFLKYWPVKPEEKDTIGSFTLNGNHDMYSGGWAYYDYALADPRFAPWQGMSSLFHLVNSHWQIFGLDTAHDDAGLKEDQTSWISKEAIAKRKTLFLSHHQYCSSYEEPAEELVKRIKPVLEQLEVAAWLWGHEHRCMTFKNVAGIRFPRCIGHGGVPVYQTHAAHDSTPDPGEWEYRDYLDGGLEHWAKFGFVVLDFFGDKVDVRYIDENGGQDHREIIE